MVSRDRENRILTIIEAHRQFKSQFVEFRKCLKNWIKENEDVFDLKIESSTDEIINITTLGVRISAEYKLQLQKDDIPIGKLSFFQYFDESNKEPLYELFFDKNAKAQEKIPQSEAPYNLKDEGSITTIIFEMLDKLLKQPPFRKNLIYPSMSK